MMIRYHQCCFVAEFYLAATGKKNFFYHHHHLCKRNLDWLTGWLSSRCRWWWPLRERDYYPFSFHFSILKPMMMTLTSWIYDNNNNNSFDQKNLNWSRGKKTTWYFAYNPDDDDHWIFFFFHFQCRWSFFSMANRLSFFFSLLQQTHKLSPVYHLWFSFIIIIIIRIIECFISVFYCCCCCCVSFYYCIKKIWKKKRWSPLTLQKKKRFVIDKWICFVSFHSFIDWRRALFPNIHSFIHLFNQILFHMFVWSLFFFLFPRILLSTCLVVLSLNDDHDDGQWAALNYQIQLRY